MVMPLMLLEILLEDPSNFQNVIWASQLLTWEENTEGSIISI